MRAFLAVMAWGFGTQAAYGPWRTREMLRPDDVPHRLLTAARLLREQGALEAYTALSRYDASRVKGLGPSFGTKFLYFCSRGDDSALILDRIVAAYLNRDSAAELNSGRWSVSTYTRYLAMMRDRASKLGVSADELEQCIFDEESRRQGNQWSDARRHNAADAPMRPR